MGGMRGAEAPTHHEHGSPPSPMARQPPQLLTIPESHILKEAVGKGGGDAQCPQGGFKGLSMASRHPAMLSPTSPQ